MEKRKYVRPVAVVVPVEFEHLMGNYSDWTENNGGTIIEIVPEGGDGEDLDIDNIG